MADELDALKRALDRFPEDMTATLRDIAKDTAETVRRRAREIMNSRTGGKADRIAVFGVAEDRDSQSFLVVSEGAVGKPKNLALWFEKGTVHMEAKPALRPAADAETVRWRERSIRAVERVADRLSQY